MRPWGMLDRQSSSFLAGRPLRVLNVSTYPLRIPDSLQGHVYNPSVAPLPKRLQRELGCEQCSQPLATRHRSLYTSLVGSKPSRQMVSRAHTQQANEVRQ